MSALVANADYYRRNLFGKCQNLTARVELSPSPGGGKPDVDVKVSHTDPWIGDSHRTSRRVFLDSDSTSLEAIHAKRLTFLTIMPKDMQLARKIAGEIA